MKKTMTPVITGIAAATIAGTAVYMLLVQKLFV